ncbi:hypothetical protein JC795_18210 [Pseudomonas veronii]|uniref:hypothetical protein n=1 Tax=Pseudomonas TaxID=286 RepID=UPI0018E8D8BA|nr:MULTISPECIES: hypothetical protein [Pseudomonas]MBJ2180128.1 hypothetical protein [Pseudomonas veronii]MDB1113921.1 hypothetical protein [Pseudomonas extremaustralis]
MREKLIDQINDSEMVAGTLSTVPRQNLRTYANNSIRAYKSHIGHFRYTAEKSLPSDPLEIADYLLRYSSTLAPSTLIARLSALSKWHKEQGFQDPTKDPRIPQLITHIKNHSSHTTTKAVPLLIADLVKVDLHMLDKLERRENFEKQGTEERLTRDRAMMLLAFWRGLTFTQLATLKISDIILQGEGRIMLSVPATKGIFASTKLPIRKSSCPTQALLGWLEIRESGRQNLFYGINKWGNVTEKEVKRFVAGYALASRCKDAEIPVPLSALSFRRGFEQWALSVGWSIQSIREYVGLNGVQEALLPLASSMSAYEISESLDER